jgi:hypothetical protein
LYFPDATEASAEKKGKEELAEESSKGEDAA